MQAPPAAPLRYGGGMEDYLEDYYVEDYVEDFQR